MIAYKSKSPTAYIEHAKEMNTIARSALRIDTRDATYVAKKISLGLSLQAAELAGKGILRALGNSSKKIRSEHDNHEVLPLLRDAEQQLNRRGEDALKPFQHFLLWTPTIDGQQLGTTIAAYMEEHVARGASAKPRNYFYPDTPTFAGPKPIQALAVMVDHIIEVADGVNRALSNG